MIDGEPDELPRIKNRRAYLDGLGDLPDWQITCFFADRSHRGRGVASAALAGALEEIARLGGGTVESYPDEVDGRSLSSSFLLGGTVAMFEHQGVERPDASPRPAGSPHVPQVTGGRCRLFRSRCQTDGDLSPAAGSVTGGLGHLTCAA